jgi:hypothetical protein
VALARPATLCEPPLSAAPIAVPPDDTVWVAPDSTLSLAATPPEPMVSWALATVAPLSVPNTVSVPPLTSEPIAVPPDSTASLPPLTVVLLAVPPLSTTCEPETMVAPEAKP